MDTFVMKLKGASTNENLPIFENVILKDWIKSVDETAALDLSTIVGGYSFDSYIMTIKFRLPSDYTGFISNRVLWSTRANQTFLRINNNSTLGVYAGSTVTPIYLFSTPLVADTDYVVSVNVTNNTVTFNGQSYTMEEHTYSSSYITNFTVNLFSDVYIGEFSFKVNSTDIISCTPVKRNGTSCFKDSAVADRYLNADGDLNAFDLDG